MPEKVQITTWGYRCERCGHEWVPMRDHAPRVCPKCKSPYWDRPRKKPKEPLAGGRVSASEVEEIVLDLMTPPERSSRPEE